MTFILSVPNLDGCGSRSDADVKKKEKRKKGNWLSPDYQYHNIAECVSQTIFSQGVIE